MRCCISSANCGSFEARAMAVGKPAASSFAKVGPDKTASECDLPKISSATVCNNRPVLRSKPLVAHIIRCSGLINGLIFCSTSANTWLGTTISKSRALLNACAKSLSISSASGKGISGKKVWFIRSDANFAIASGWCPQR